MNRHHRAFSLIELLAAISIVCLLLSVLLPALGRAKATAQEARSMSGLRQMMIGYTMYQHDHHGHVLLGYTPPTLGGRPVTVLGPDGRTYTIPVAERYPWRLAPYVSDVWEILHSHTEVPPLPRAEDSDSEALLKAYALSINPTYGLNTCYVGGSNGVWQGFVPQGGDYAPNTGKHVVFRDAEVRRPSDLIVFVDSKARNASTFTNPDAGLHFVTPPRARGHKWRAAGDAFEIVAPFGQLVSLPEGRYSNAAVTGFFDAHVSLMRPAELDDMRHWANWAQTPDYDF